MYPGASPSPVSLSPPGMIVRLAGSKRSILLRISDGARGRDARVSWASTARRGWYAECDE